MHACRVGVYFFKNDFYEVLVSTGATFVSLPLVSRVYFSLG